MITNDTTTSSANKRSEKQSLKRHLLNIQKQLEQLQQTVEHQPDQQNTIPNAPQEALQNNLKTLHPADLAYILESLPLDERQLIWSLIDPKKQALTLLEVSEAVRSSLISDSSEEGLAAGASTLDTDEIADLAPDLPKKVMKRILMTLNPQKREHLQSVLAYPENQVGALMDFGMISIRADITLKAISRYLRQRGKLPPHSDKLFVVDRNKQLTGILPTEMLLTKSPSAHVGEMMITDFVLFHDADDATEASRAFERYDLISAPVVNEKNELIGRLCVDNVMDFIRDETDDDVLIQAGVSEEEDLSSSVLKSARNRWGWLFINVITAFIATRVIGLFEGTIMHLVALASLMPIVAAIGGNTGNQTSMLIIRSLALGQINTSNVKRLIKKEIFVGMLNGIVWGSIIGMLVFLLYQDRALGLVMAIAMLLNLLVAALVGISIPLLRHKMGKDPAVGTSVIITFITDAMGFLIFLGLASMILL